jgi:two-component system chemotaxis response regulator CheY
MKTLVVEDEFTNRLLLQSLLARYGDCHIAVNGEEAVNAFHQAVDSRSYYNLICMDIRMPGMDGVEAVRQIRALEEEHGVLSTAGVNILMVTAMDEPKEVFQSFHALCDAYLIKPIDANKLIEELRKMELITG